jgi:hypothetical protein
MQGSVSTFNLSYVQVIENVLLAHYLLLCRVYGAISAVLHLPAFALKYAMPSSP